MINGYAGEQQLQYMNLRRAPQLLLQLERPITHVLVDNDELVHRMWGMEAKLKGVRIHHYSSPEDVLKNISHFDERTSFFIDYDMNNALNGIDLARIIKRALGARVILCTGHDPSSFEDDLRAGIIDRVSGKEFIAHEY